MKRTTVSERALVLAPRGRDASIAAAMLEEGGVQAVVCPSLPALIREMDAGAAFIVVTEEALNAADLHPLAAWIGDQEEWSDLPFVLLTHRGGGLERNPAAGRHLELLGNVTFLERPFHPTTLVSLARSALRGRRRQYEARARLQALRESEERLRLAVDNAEVGFWDVDLVNEALIWPPLTKAMFGISPDVPVSMQDFYAGLHPDDLQATSVAFAAAADPKQRALYDVEYRTIGKEDGVLRWVAAKGRGVFSEEGRCLRVAGTAVDVTHRKRAEQALRDLNETLERRVEAAVSERATVMAQLHEAQKLETIGQLTGGVAHDINNLLTPITGALDLLNRRYAEDDARTARLLDGALQSAERAKILVSRLLGFARRQSLETRAVDVAELLDGMRDLVASSVGTSVELRFVPERDLPPALADPNQLELAILNLCVNARDAMEGAGALTVSAERTVVGPRGGGGLGPGAYVRVSVVDTGVGMDQETLARAVEPFFSTKGVGKGTGLGLSMVHGLAAQLGGVFTLSSAPGEGTRADLYLPVAASAPERSVPVRVAPSRPLTPLTVLLVDDEDLVRRGTAEMLRELGHTVHEAAGGAQALGLLSEGLRVDAVVTDYLMPRMNGAELARRLASHGVTAPVLVVTGYAGGDLDLGLPQLAKPFRQADLAAALERLLASRDQKVVSFSRAAK